MQTGPARPSTRFTAAVGATALVALGIRLYLVLVARPTCPKITSTPQTGCFRIWGDALYGYWQGALITAGHWWKDPAAYYLGGHQIRDAAGKPPLYPGFLGAVGWYGGHATPWWATLLVALAVAAVVGLLARRLLSPLTGALLTGSTVLALILFGVLGSDSTRAQRLAFVVCGVGAVVLIGVAGRHIGGERVGMIAAAIAAIHPLMWINDGMLQIESLYALLVVWAVILAIGLWRRPGLGRALGLAAVLAITAMTRAEAELLVPAMVIPLVAGVRDWTRLRRLGVVAAAMALALAMWAPWFAYNASRFRAAPFYAMTDGSGAVLVSANCDETYYGDALGYWAAHCFDQPFVAEVRGPDTTVEAVAARLAKFDDYAVRAIRGGAVTVNGDVVRRPSQSVSSGTLVALSLPTTLFDESEIDRVARTYGTDYMSDHLSRLPVVVVARVTRMLNLYKPMDNVRIDGTVEGRGVLSSKLGLYLHWLLIPFATYGVVLLRRRRFTMVPFYALIGVVVVTAAATFGVTRYRVPIDICEIMLGAVAIDHLWTRWRVGPGDPSEEVRR